MLRLLAVCIACCGYAAQAEPLDVFVSILPLKQFVERIGGEHVRVTVLVGPGQAPETYAPGPRQMEALSRAQVYFAIGGMPFETAWQQRITSLNPALRWVRTDQGIALRRWETDDHDTEHAHGGEDPHIWLSPELARQMSRTILTTLQAAAPQHSADLSRNHAAWDTELAALHTELQSIFAAAPRKRFMIFHPSWGYFAATYGLQQIGIEAFGKEPGPRSLANLIDFARNEKIAAIFVQAQFSRRAAQAIADAVGARLVEVDALAENYLDNLRSAARMFAGQ